MKKKLTYLLLLCTLLFSVPACSQISELPDTEETNPVVAEDQTTDTEPASTTTESTDTTDTSGQTDESLPQDDGNTASIDLSAVPEYSGSPSIEINGNVPFFSEEDKSRTDAFEEYSELDSLGRCGVAYANICTELMPTEERGEIGSVKPSGWHTANYNGYVEGNYLYNRCHLIGFQLAGEYATSSYYSTGTVKNYSGNATDTGNTGDNTNDASSIESAAPEQAAESSADQNTDAPAGDYIINTNTGKFHFPTCPSVSRMNDSNKKEVQESRDQLIAEGYSPCKNCNP